MEYTLGPEESTLSGVRRIARLQLEQAVLELQMSGEPIDLRIHSVRKRIKRLRGLLRLVEAALDAETFERENECLRGAASQLAPARRAAALLATFDALLERFPGKLGPEAQAAFRRRLVEERDRAVEAVHGDRHERAITALRAALDRLDDWPLTADGWRLVGGGFAKTYERGRRALRRARNETTTEALHFWRRFAKYHWYHLRLLASVWPPVLLAFDSALDELGELLGAEHDLDDLRQLLLSGPPSELWLDQLSTLLRLLEERRRELQQAAFAVGGRIYAEKPRAAARRMRAYFEQAIPSGQ